MRKFNICSSNIYLNSTKAFWASFCHWMKLPPGKLHSIPALLLLLPLPPLLVCSLFFFLHENEFLFTYDDSKKRLWRVELLINIKLTMWKKKFFFAQFRDKTEHFNFFLVAVNSSPIPVMHHKRKFTDDNFSIFNIPVTLVVWLIYIYLHTFMSRVLFYYATPSIIN